MNEITEKIKIILLNDWDPIGINLNHFLSDEYDNYILKVYNWIKGNISINELADNLYKIETEDIGVNGNYFKCHKVAEKLLDLKEKNGTDFIDSPL